MGGGGKQLDKDDTYNLVRFPTTRKSITPDDAIAIIREIAFHRQVGHLHRLGERTLLEFLIKFVGVDDNLMFDLQVLLDRYANLTPEMIDRLDAREIRDDFVVIDGERQ